MRRTWSEFRDALANGEITYDDVDRAKQLTFLRVYDDLFCQNGGIQLVTKKLIDYTALNAGRGSILDEKESINYERFIPKKEYIKSENRFSPAGVEWLYLAIGNAEDNAINCSMKECRARSGDRFGFCSFSIDGHHDAKIVDLTAACGLSYEQLNQKLENYGQKQVQKGLKIAKAIGFVPNTRINKAEFAELLTEWAVYTYTKMLSKQIFIPLDTDNKKLEYTPFQTLAQYFISLGYKGIAYSSTVYEDGKNIVLFDKSMAIPCGIIKDFTVYGE